MRMIIIREGVRYEATLFSYDPHTAVGDFHFHRSSQYHTAKFIKFDRARQKYIAEQQDSENYLDYSGRGCTKCRRTAHAAVDTQ